MSDWSRMRWLLCDYGEVLSLAPPASDRRRLLEFADWGPADPEAFWAGYWAARPDYDRGDVTAAEYWERVLHRAPAPKTLDALTAVDTAMWLHPNQDSLDAVAGVDGLALFSNAPVEVAVGIDSQLWLAPFDRRFYSCRIRATKPDPAAYEKVLAQLQARPQDVVFVDDRPPNVEAARDLGIGAHLFEGPETLRALASGFPRRPR